MINEEKNNQECYDFLAIETDESVGDRLAQRREAKGLGVREVAEILRLSVDYVRALEAGSYERLPCSTFVKGYLKSYAKLLELDEGKVLEQFSAIEIHEDNVEKKPSFDAFFLRRKRQGIVMLAALTFVLLLLMGGGMYLWQGYEKRGGAEALPSADQASSAVDTDDNLSEDLSEVVPEEE